MVMKGGENMNKKITVSAITLAILGTSILGGAAVFAQGTDDSSTSIVQKISDKFGLKKEDVQAVFDQERSERRSTMEAKHEEQLAQYVKDGKITEAQKKLILEKRSEMEKNMKQSLEALKNMTPDERKSQMEAKRTELEAWAKENGIDPTYLIGGMGRGGHRMMGKMNGNIHDQNATPSQ